MNREQAKELLPIIQAFAEGKKVDYRYGINDSWYTLLNSGEMTFEAEVEWRIKPEPREWFVLRNRTSGLTSLYIEGEYANPVRSELIKVREVIEE